MHFATLTINCPEKVEVRRTYYLYKKTNIAYTAHVAFNVDELNMHIVLTER